MPVVKRICAFNCSAFASCRCRQKIFPGAKRADRWRHRFLSTSRGDGRVVLRGRLCLRPRPNQSSRHVVLRRASDPSARGETGQPRVDGSAPRTPPSTPRCRGRRDAPHDRRSTTQDRTSRIHRRRAPFQTRYSRVGHTPIARRASAPTLAPDSLRLLATLHCLKHFLQSQRTVAVALEQHFEHLDRHLRFAQLVETPGQPLARLEKRLIRS